MNKFLLIDANSLIHRSFHALPTLTSLRGEPVNAVYGLCTMLLKILRDHNPAYIVAAFDRPEPTFRKEMFKEYKAHRKPAVDELISQIIKSHEVFDRFGVKVVEKAGLEADDIIGILAEKFKQDIDFAEGKIVIFSGDKDNLQLIDKDKVVVEMLRTGVSKTITYNESLFLQDYGFSPEQLVDYKALMGDSSDNIPGVRGVGSKTASGLILEFRTIEGIYENIELIPSKTLKEKLVQSEDNAFLSKKLATIKRDYPLGISLNDAKFDGFNKEELKKYFEELGFKSLAERM
ncbi:hypothetical protein KJ671_01100 [Patescibacteria group bacterium]|nr:hypothetical protein [Patescibacteria group bacterium]